MRKDGSEINYVWYIQTCLYTYNLNSAAILSPIEHDKLFTCLRQLGQQNVYCNYIRQVGESFIVTFVKLFLYTKYFIHNLYKYISTTRVIYKLCSIHTWATTLHSFVVWNRPVHYLSYLCCYMLLIPMHVPTQCTHMFI